MERVKETVLFDVKMLRDTSEVLPCVVIWIDQSAPRPVPRDPVGTGGPDSGDRYCH